MVVEPERRQIGRDVGWVLAAQDRVEEDPVVQTIEAAERDRRRPGRRDARRRHRVQVQRDADLLGAAGAKDLDAETVGEQQVVDGGDSRARLGSPGACTPAA